MAINFDALRASVEKDSKGNFQNIDAREHVLKLTHGKTTVRLIPSAFNPENPFTEIALYWNIERFPFLSPGVFDDTDPIYEFRRTVWAEIDRQGGKEQADAALLDLSKKLRAATHHYVPVVIRKKDGSVDMNQGVKFWRVSKTVYTELIQDVILNEDYGDITDPASGHDLVITYNTETENGIPKTTIMPRPKQSKLSDDADLVADLLSEEMQVNPLDMYSRLSPQEVQVALEKFLVDNAYAYRDDNGDVQFGAPEGSSDDSTMDSVNKALAMD